MTTKLCVFVSSVQKELEDERLIVQNLVNTDAFLSAHCTPVLYELEPASPAKALEGCLQSLDGCQVYLLIVGIEYGIPVGGLSITHAEYLRAKKNALPILAFIKGDRSANREEGITALLAEIDVDGFKYKRFGNIIELQKEVRAALVKLLTDKFGIVLLAKDPSMVFPQCRILADAYRSTEPDGDPRDHEDIRAPMPLAIDRAIAFIDRNTRHPMRIVGLNRVRLDEYPVDGLREAMVNAVAHRQYEDAGRKIILEIFADRVILLSPGLPPRPITLANLRKGKYRPCSRNPVLAQCLSYFHRIEERGSGFRRMHDQMLDHGLDPPLLGTDMGYFQVIFLGPGENIERLRVPEKRLLVTPAVEAGLNERQRRIMAQALETGSVTTGWCMETLGVVRDTAHRDLVGLVKRDLLVRKGSGRSAKYFPKEGSPV